MNEKKDKSIMGAAGTGAPAGMILGAVIGWFVKGEKGAIWGAAAGAAGMTYIVWKKRNK